MIIETGIKGLSIKIGTDGVWVNISSSTKKHTSFNLVNYATNKNGFIRRAILDWCEETTKSHNNKMQSDAEPVVGSKEWENKTMNEYIKTRHL